MGDDDPSIVEWSKNRSQNINPEISISIYKTDQLKIPTAVYREYFPDGKDAAKLLYDRGNDRIGIRPAAKDDPDSYSVGSQTPTINCAKYLETFDLIVDESVELEAKWDEDTETIWATVEHK